MIKIAYLLKGKSWMAFANTHSRKARFWQKDDPLELVACSTTNELVDRLASQASLERKNFRADIGRLVRRHQH